MTIFILCCWVAIGAMALAQCLSHKPPNWTQYWLLYVMLMLQLIEKVMTVVAQ